MDQVLDSRVCRNRTTGELDRPNPYRKSPNVGEDGLSRRYTDEDPQVSSANEETGNEY